MKKLTAAKVKVAAKEASYKLVWPESAFVAGALWYHKTYVEQKNDSAA